MFKPSLPFVNRAARLAFATAGAIALTACDVSVEDAPLVARFEPGACRYAVGEGQVEGTTVRCGELIVPEHHGASGGELRLQVLRFGASIRKDAAPLVWLQGGPGGDIDGTSKIPLTVTQQLTAERDFIVYTQRGTGKSTPSLACPEVDELPMIGNPDADAEVVAETKALSACQQRLTAAKVDLTAYTTEENAADLEDLRSALGYPQLELWGTSYGSALALEVMRSYGSKVRLSVIDAIVPPQSRWTIDATKSFQGALTKLLARCDASAPCKAAFGDGRTLFAQAYASLKNQPLMLPTPKISLQGRDLVQLVFGMMYSASNDPVIPLLLDAARDRDVARIEAILAPVVEDLLNPGIALGMYTSVVCHDQLQYLTAADLDAAYAGLFPELVETFKRFDLASLERCKTWPLPAAKAKPFEAVTSSVPTLVFSGELDPITPPGYGELVLPTLSKSRHVVVAGGGHGSSTAAPCTVGLLLSFLADPRPEALDGSCLSGLGEIDFLTELPPELAPRQASMWGAW
jgi:pimeloyl-ACP methyl ester carboxylesterase